METRHYYAVQGKYTYLLEAVQMMYRPLELLVAQQHEQVQV